MKNTVFLLTISLSFFLCIKSNAEEFVQICNLVQNGSTVAEEDSWWVDVLKNQELTNPILNISGAERLIEMAKTGKTDSVFKQVSYNEGGKIPNEINFIISSGKLDDSLKNSTSPFTILGENVDLQKVIPKINKFMKKKFWIDDFIIQNSHEKIFANYSSIGQSGWINPMKTSVIEFNGKSVKSIKGICPMARNVYNGTEINHFKMKKALVSILFLDELKGPIKEEMFNNVPSEDEFKDQTVEVPVIESHASVDLSKMDEPFGLIQASGMALDKYGLSEGGATVEYIFGGVSILKDDSFKLDRPALIQIKTENSTMVMILRDPSLE